MSSGSSCRTSSQSRSKEAEGGPTEVLGPRSLQGRRGGGESDRGGEQLNNDMFSTITGPGEVIPSEIHDTSYMYGASTVFFVFFCIVLGYQCIEV